VGFEPEETTIKLNFKDQSDLDGLEVVMRSMSVKEYNDQMASALLTGAEGINASIAVIGKFTDKLVSWNITRGGEPVPADRAGVDSQDTNLITRIWSQYQAALTTVPTRRSASSSNGSLPNRSEELTLGLGSMSESPES
jgi:hypothetical protein